MISESALQVFVKNTFIYVPCEGDEGPPPARWFSEDSPACCKGLNEGNSGFTSSTHSEASGDHPGSQLLAEVDQVDSLATSADVSDEPEELVFDTSTDIDSAPSAEQTSVAGEDPAPAADDGELVVALNLGSIYHPHLCNQACKWMKAGHCDAGASCEFCHLPHKRSQRNSVVFDKQNRQLVSKLTGTEFASLLSPILTQKVAELKLGPRASVALQEWSQAAGAAVCDQGSFGGVPPSELRRFTKCLRSMSVNVLCRVFKSFSDNTDLSNRLNEVFALLQALAVESSS